MEQKHLLQIYVRDCQNDLILPVTQGGFICARDNELKLYIGDTSIQK